MDSEVSAKSSTIIDKVMETETGRRKPEGVTRLILICTAIIWSLFQLWIISPIPYWLGIGVFNDTASRSIHLAFSVFLAFLSFPFLSSSPRKHVPVFDWILALAAAFCACYLYFFQDQLVTRPGAPILQDIIVSYAGLLLLLEATRRGMGWPMTIVAIIFIVYVFAGPYAPDLIAHKGASLSRAASQFWLTSEGVFGVALGVSTSFVFLYVLFGAMLEQAGAGNYLTMLSFSLLGHLRGGPAKAAVVASGLHGLISGSSIANVLTCGPVTIMLMKKVGFSSEKAGAVEVAAGSNGQIMPPVMGAAAFLMVEYVHIPYSELITHAFLPAVLAYISLLYIVHLEAVKMGMQGLPRQSTMRGRLIGWAQGLAALVIVLGLLYFALSWIPAVFGEASSYVAIGLLLLLYVALVFLATHFPELEETSVESLLELPPLRTTLLAGLYYLLPLGVLVWCLMILEMSPGLAAFYACAFMSLILLTQRPLLAFFRKKAVKPEWWPGFYDYLRSLRNGARNMIGIGLATASAGIIVGAVSLTGVGQVLASVVETLSMGHLTLVLIMTAGLSLILGMGLPTTANYIIVSTLLTPVIIQLAAGHGLELPLVAVHLFVFYFGIMADATPPVALAAFAASGISGGDPLKTGVQGFIYEMRTAILPFVFLFNTELLMINIRSLWHLFFIITISVLACMAFASAMQRFFIVKNRWWETLLLIAIMICFFRPDYIRDQFYPPYQEVPAGQLMETVAQLPVGSNMRLRMEVDNGYNIREKLFVLPVEEGTTGEERLESIGLIAEAQSDADGYLEVIDVLFNSLAENLGIKVDNDNRIMGLAVTNLQPAKEWFTVPGFIILGVIMFSQLKRRRYLLTQDQDSAKEE